MATREEIKEWLECCGAKRQQYVAFHDARTGENFTWYITDGPLLTADILGANTSATPLHLFTPSLTGIQGPTFAEWKKQKGREGKVEKITKMLEEAYGGTMLWPKNIAREILDAIEGEGK